MDPVKYLEDVRDFPIDPADILTDEDLKNGGLIKTEAWFRTNSSASALRASRYRDKKETQGLKQINLLAPIELHETLRQIARTGRMPEPTIKEVPVEIIKEVEVVKEVATLLSKSDRDLMEIGRDVTYLYGWRRRIVFFLLDLLDD